MAEIACPRGLVVDTEDPLLPLDHGGPLDHPCTPLDAEVLRRPLAERFRTMAERHGDRLALQDRQQSLTYRALLERVGQILQLLRAQRPRSEPEGGEAGTVPVAIYCGHGCDFAAAILAALWLGRAYVPLDPGFPDARNARILAHSGADLVLTQAAFLERLERLAPTLPRLPLDAPPEGRGGPLPRPAPAESLAAIYYTSGSTGAPKGVVLTQRNLLHDAGQYVAAAHIGQDDRLSLLYSLSTLGSLRDLFGALLTGASAHLFSLAREGIDALPAFLRARRISLYHSFPNVFRGLTGLLADEERLESLRLVYLAGDRVDAEDVARFRRHLPPGAFLYLGIGASECATLYRHWFLDHRTTLTDGPPPVGRRLPDRRVTLLDAAGAPVAPGEAGEIVVASRFLALGYWRDPLRTAEGFLPDPEDPGSRRFRTGDRGRLRPDGLLEFMGRVDALVKIGGHLIDPSEMEAVLRGQPALADAALSVLDGEAGPRLLAWLVPAEGREVAPETLHAALAARFPASALPVAYHRLERLPRTPNGKLDRAALTALGRKKAAAQAAPDEPRTPLERHLCAIWAEVLKRERVGIHDNYFTALGGDSLGALTLVRAVEAAIGRTLPVMTLFRLASVAEMARAIEQAPGRPRHPGVLELNPLGDAPPLYFAPGAGEQAADNLRNLVRRLGARQPAFCLQEEPKPWPRPYAATLERVAEECTDTLLAVQPEGAYRLAGFSFGGRLAFAIAQRLEALGRPVALLVIVDSPAGLFRARPRRKTYEPTDRRAAYTGLSRRYVPAPYAGDITYIRAEQHWEAALCSPDGNWGAVTTGRLRVLSLPGNHRDLLAEPLVAELSERLGRLLAETREAVAPGPVPDAAHEGYWPLAAKRAELAGDTAAEIEAYRRALAAAPHQPLFVHLNLWEALLASRRDTEASAAHRRAEACFGEEPAFHYRSAQTLRLAGRLAAAEAHLDRADALGCESPALLLERGRLESRRDRHVVALGHFRAALDRDPHYRQALQLLCRCLLALGREAESRPYANRLAALKRKAQHDQ